MSSTHWIDKPFNQCSWIEKLQKLSCYVAASLMFVAILFLAGCYLSLIMDGVGKLAVEQDHIHRMKGE